MLMLLGCGEPEPVTKREPLSVDPIAAPEKPRIDAAVPVDAATR